MRCYKDHTAFLIHIQSVWGSMIIIGIIRQLLWIIVLMWISSFFSSLYIWRMLICCIIWCYSYYSICYQSQGSAGEFLTPDIVNRRSSVMPVSPGMEENFDGTESTAVSVGVRVRPLNSRYNYCIILIVFIA